MAQTVAEVPRLRKIRLRSKLSAMTEEPKPRTQVTDPTGQAVAENVRRIREKLGWSTYELSRKLRKAGRPIAPSALAKLERKERRVDVGDLLALAVVLNASPQSLLLPPRDDSAETIEITGAGAVPADAAWVWMPPPEQPLRLPAGADINTALLEFFMAAWPPNAFRRGRAAIFSRMDALASEDPEAARRRDAARRLAAEREDPPIGEFVMRKDGSDG